MRKINHIVIHCTATPQTTSVESILRYWREFLGWRNPGYHFIIEANGRVHQLHPIDKPSNGVRGHNHDSIHISYIGGVDGENNPQDTRTEPQRSAIEGIVKAFKSVFVDADVKGHRDFEGVNKACPSFEVSEWLKDITN